jgi:hypothetical protein
MRLTRKAREQARHCRAVVLQELGALADADPRPVWKAEQEKSARLAQRAQCPCNGWGCVACGG